MNGKQKWESLLKEVSNPNITYSRVGSERSDFVPLAYVADSREIMQEKHRVGELYAKRLAS